MEIDPEYIGDNVYASFDGHHIVLTLQRPSPDGSMTNQIALEPLVMDALLKYQRRINEAIAVENRLK